MSKSQDAASIPQVYAFPAAPLQERIWSLEKDNTPDPAWNVAVRFQLLGTLSISRFQRALDDVLAQTEILRTRFAVLGSELKQVVTDVCSMPLRFVDCSDSEHFEIDLEVISRQEAEIPFEMAHAPLLRVVLVRRDYQSHTLLITGHHAIMDGVSVGLLSDALLAAYDRDGEEASNNDMPLQFADYAIWLQEYRKSPEYHEHASYWNRNLAGAVEVSEERNSIAKGSAHIESILLPRSLTNAAQQLTQQLEVTFSQMALAIMACVVSKPDGIIGVPVACRSQVQLEGLIGPFVNYLPIRTTYTPDNSFEQMLAAIAEVSNEALAHSEYRYEDILRTKGIPNGSLFDTVFICQRDFVHPRVACGLELTAMPSVSPGALHKLTVFMVERSDGWRLSCETPAQYSPEYRRDLLQRYKAILQAVCNNPRASVASLTGNSSLQTPVALKDEILSTELVSEETLFPVSSTQERYWSLDRIDPGNSRLNLHIRYAVEETLDYSILQQALRSLAKRHEALRTNFTEQQGSLQQRVRTSCEVYLHHIDKTDEELNDETVEAFFSKERRRHFNLEGDQLWSALLITANNHSYLSLTFAHSICDGWSCGVVMRDLLKIYEAIAAERSPDLPSLSTSFGEMVANGHVPRQTQDFSDQLAYWDKILSDPTPALKLPADRLHEDIGVVTRSVDPMLAMTVNQIARDHSVTTASVYAAAYRALLLKYTGQSNLLLSSPMANRTPGTEGIVGPFADNLLLRSEIGETFEDALQATQNTLLMAVENAVPLQHLMERIHSNHESPGASIGFMYQEAFVRDLRGDRLTMRAMSNPVTESSFDWYMAVIDRAGEVSLEFTPACSNVSSQLADAILEDFELSLSGYLMTPRKQLTKIDGCTRRVQQICEAAPKEEQAALSAAHVTTHDEILTVSNEKIASMVEIWRTVFGRQQITRRDNFFALGGHSLLLARLQVAIEREFSYRIFAADIFAAPTCELLAQHMESKQKKHSTSWLDQIIPLQPAGEETPLIMISQSMIMRELAQRLGNNQPCFTIQFTQEDVERIGQNATMQQVASLYIDYLRKIRPTGPYRLGGWCVSGWVAYEMAQQLKAAGEEVELLLILDAWAPNFWRDLRGTAKVLGRSSYYAHRLYYEFSQLLPGQRGDNTFGSAFQTLWVTMLERVGKILPSSVGRQHATPVFPDEPFEQMMDSAAKSYRPKPYADSRTMVFRSEEQPRGGTLPKDMGWHQFLPSKVRVISLPGDHTGMFSGLGAIIMSSHISDALAGHPQNGIQDNAYHVKTPSSWIGCIFLSVVEIAARVLA